MRRHRARELGEHGQEQHGYRSRKAEQAVAHDARQIKGDRGEPGRRHRARVDVGFFFRATFLIGEIHIIVLIGLQAPFARQMRISLADEVEEAGKHDRGQAAEHDRRQDLRENIALRLMQDFRIADRQRYGSFADTAGHDRDDDKKEGVVGAETHQDADGGSDQARGDRTRGERHEDFQKALHQHSAIHAQNAANDDAGNEQVEKIRIFRELDDRLLDLRRQELIIGKRRGNECRKDRSGANPRLGSASACRSRHT